MSRLKQMPPALARIGALVGYLEPDHDVARRDKPGRRWYSTARWKRLRWECLVRDQFTCRMCGRIEPNSALLVADHKRPHRGDPRLFWDQSNIQCLCKGCHDREKQRMERRGQA